VTVARTHLERQQVVSRSVEEIEGEIRQRVAARMGKDKAERRCLTCKHWSRSKTNPNFGLCRRHRIDDDTWPALALTTTDFAVCSSWDLKE
jgi:hypothetical protein